MKRFHVNLSVEDINESVRFYSALFDAEPTVHKDDYAKWMLDDPRINFAVSTRQCGDKGVSHLGIQVDSDDELGDVFARLEKAGGATLKEEEAQCCYATSTKQWIKDPEGVAWETFLTRGEMAVYGDHGIPGVTTDSR